MADVDTTSYKSLYYADLADSVSEQHQLPPGLLKAVVQRGERSNADQVSEAGAKTVFQIIPATRDAALKKWGIDAYQSPENAAMVAARVLKDSLDRNKGFAPLAVAEYIGGTDPKNWGPTTREYVKRVTGETLATGNGDVKQTTYERVRARQEAANAPSIARVYDAYKSGRMAPEDKAAFEADVQSGRVVLPKGMAVAEAKPTAPETAKDGTQMAPQGVIEAYQTGKMTPEEAHEFETDVAEKRVAVPEGTQIAKPQGIGGRVADAAMEAVSGAKRETEETSTLPSYENMPEFGANMATFKTALGTMMTAPAETVKIIQQNMPGVTARQDSKGNYVLRSAQDGKEYVIQPGFTAGDVPRAAGAVAAFTPAGRATSIIGGGAAAGATQAVIEGTQAATGGDFDTKDVALAAAGGAAVPAAARVIQAAKPAVAQAVEAVQSRLPQAAVAAGGSDDAIRAAAQRAASEAPHVPDASLAPGATAAPDGAPPANPAARLAELDAKAKGTPDTTVPGPDGKPITVPGQPAQFLTDAEKAERAALRNGEVIPPASGTPPAALAPDLTIPPAPAMSAEELAQTTRKASTGGIGSEKAMNKLADQAAPDAATVKAMDELGFEYQPDHVTTNQVYRELAQVVKSIPGSQTGAEEMRILAANAEKADALLTKLGGSRDLSTVGAKVGEALHTIHADLKKQAKELFDAVAAKIDPVTPTPATNTLAFVRERARQLGGEDKLSAGEKDILKNFGGDAHPTYALVDEERKALNAAKYNNQSKFATMESRQRDLLINAMRADQGAVAKAAGAGELWEAANKSTQAYKAIQDDMVTLFGNQLEKSIVPKLGTAMAQLSKGDVANFVKMIKAIPESMRKDVVASGLSVAFGKNARDGLINFTNYAKWFEGLQQNKQAYNALFANLPEGAAKDLTNLYKAANGIRLATREAITTGRIATGVKVIEENLLKGDSLLSRIFEVAKKSGVAEAVTSSIGLPGAGTAAAIASALTKGKTSALKAADALINSPEFVAAVRANTKQNIQRLAHSKKFTAFVRASGNPQELKDREKWIAQAIQAKRESKK